MRPFLAVMSERRERFPRETRPTNSIPPLSCLATQMRESGGLTASPYDF